MKSFSFIFAGTSEFARDCLKIFLELETFVLKGVLSQPDQMRGRGMKKQSSPVKAFALEKGFPVWTPEKGSDPRFLEEIKKQNCDFSFVCSYGQILPKTYLEIFPKACINLHFSLLPRWRGAAPVQRALMAGDKKTGVCIQVMNTELDAGDIIGQRDFEIQEEDNSENLFERSLKEAQALIAEDLLEYLRGEREVKTQDSTKKTYAHKIEKKEAQILWEKSAQDIHNKIRGLFLGPQAFSFLKGKRIKIYRSQVVDEHFPDFKAGQICQIGTEELLVKCGKGAISLLEVQREGRNKQKIRDFLKGYPLSLKETLSSVSE